MNNPWQMNDSDTHRKRAQTAPPGGLDGPSHPQSLMPGRAPRKSISERPHIFSANQTRLSITNDVRSTHAAPLPQLYPTHVANHLHPPPSSSPPPLPSRPPRPTSSAIPHHPSLFFERSISSAPPPPPIPPKIPLFSKPTPPVILDESLLFRPPPAIPTLNAPVLDTISVSVKHDPPLPAHDPAEAALSHFASKGDNEVQNKNSLQEDEDLARALEASLLDYGGRGRTSARLDATGAKLNANDTSSKLERSGFEGPTSSATEYQQHKSGPSPKRKKGNSFLARSPDASNLPMSDKDSKILDDEAYARQLAQEEERNATIPPPETTREITSPTVERSELPQYEIQSTNHDRITRTEFIEGSLPDGVTTTTTPASNVSHLPMQTNAVPLVQPTSPLLSHAHPPSYTETTPPLPDTSRGSDSPDVPHDLRNRTDAPRATILTSPIRNMHRADSFVSVLNAPRNEVQSSSEPTAQGLVNVNSFVDKELFIGVTVGFMTPTISTRLVPLPTVMPNIITLPYGRAAPLHLQGPSWRHLLKLMAKLSGTRLEPTVSAMEFTKTDHKLRTVIQFIKPHPSSPDWRTILYFTLDFPSPQQLHHHNVNELPYSYTLSSPLPLLYQASDTPVSKTYTIPASECVPYPTLPVTLPSLAAYLQAALEESRRYLHDSSSNHRKLAKMVQTCYRCEDDWERSPERNGVSGLFKKVIGRNNKSPKPRRGGNEDTYELVTPFVADEWG